MKPNLTANPRSIRGVTKSVEQDEARREHSSRPWGEPAKRFSCFL